MSLLDLGPYIEGKQFTQDAKEPYRIELDLFSDSYKKMSKSNTALSNIHLCEIANEFYTAEPDIKEYIPRKAREEIFYAVKLGFATVDVPAKCIYYITKVYNIYKMPNLIFKLIPEREYKVFFQRNYLASGYTIRDVICTFCNQDYQPFSQGRLKVQLNDYTEVYVPTTDMDAIIPTKIASLLSDSDLYDLAVDQDGLQLHGKHLKFLAGYNGGINSVYDLRRLI